MRNNTSREDENKARQVTTDIERDVINLTAEEFRMKTVGDRVAVIESDLAVKFSALDPEHAPAIDEIIDARARLEVLKSWLTNPPPLRRAIQHLAATLSTAKPTIQEIAQSRCAEESFPSECHWTSQLMGIETADLANQARVVREVSKTVLGDLGIILQARRPILLTSSERQSGILRMNGMPIRKLSAFEILKGVVDE